MRISDWSPDVCSSDLEVLQDIEILGLRQGVRVVAGQGLEPHLPSRRQRGETEEAGAPDLPVAAPVAAVGQPPARALEDWPRVEARLVAFYWSSGRLDDSRARAPTHTATP